MKFWKPVLLTFTLFSAITSAIVYSGCEKDPCIDVKCENGGSCKRGVCSCPTGFEGATCADRMTKRFLGYYAGYSVCNNGAEIIDTIFLYEVPKKTTNLSMIQKTHKYDTLTATVSSNESTYNLFIPDKIATNYSKVYHITLQSDKTLILNSYERDLRTPGDTVYNTCFFSGTKHSFPVK